jgi:N-acetylmuramoyl-L-alanine amidase
MNINKTNLKTNGSLKWGNYPTKIILHHPEFNGTVEELNEIMINDGDVMIGYNYYVRKDGTVWEGRPVDAIGANCYGQNATSIGVAFEGNFMIDSMIDTQFNSGVELCKYLMQQYSSIKEIGPHKKYYATACPGANFPVDIMITAAMTGYTAPVVTASNVIKLWDSGDAVKDIQSKLFRLGYEIYGGADGIFGQATYNGVEKFQADNSLNIDGEVGQQTLSALNKKIGSLPTSDDNVKQVQRNLNTIIGTSLTVDGITGQATKAAIMKFQSIMELTQDGIAGPMTISAITEILSKPTCSRDSTKQYAVRFIQWKLGCTVDGQFGWNTTTAVQNFQVKNGLTPDGIVGPLTFTALLK